MILNNKRGLFKTQILSINTKLFPTQFTFLYVIYFLYKYVLYKIINQKLILCTRFAGMGKLFKFTA